MTAFFIKEISFFIPSKIAKILQLVHGKPRLSSACLLAAGADSTQTKKTLNVTHKLAATACE